MQAAVVKREIDDPAVRAHLASASPYLFQQPEWGRVLASLGHAVAYYCLEEGGRIVLVQPAVAMRFGFFRLLYCGLPYGGPAGDLSRSEDLFTSLAQVARRKGFHRIRLSHNLYDGEPLPSGWKVQEHVQQVLHFAGRSREQVWEDFKGRVRRDVRLAERRGVLVEDAKDQASRDALFEMYHSTMARNETFDVWRREMIERMWDLLVAPGQGEMLVARYQGQLLAGLATFYSGQQCFYFLGASGGQMRNLCPSDALLWEAIRRAMNRGCQDFDFMISSRDDQQLIDFKAKWGAETHPFRFCELDLRPLPCRLWDLAFRLVRTPLGGWLVRKLKRGA